jgi:glyoxylase-like metal-dependent hydrolase (beta-lactamase superfamily II)
MQEIANNIFVETGFRGCNVGFIATEEGVVMIDTPQLPVDAMKWRDEIAKHGKVRYLINTEPHGTEPHGDHFSGNYFFDGTVVAHEGTRAAIMSASVDSFVQGLAQKSPESLSLVDGFEFRPPTITFTDKLTLYSGDHNIQLINMPGHTAYQAAAVIPDQKVAFTSDNIFYKVQAWLHGALPFKWLDSLKQLMNLDVDVLVPGHGSICDRSYIPEMSSFIQKWIDVVTAAINQGLSLEAAQDTISLLEHYPMDKGSEPMGKQVQRMNVARLYQVLQTPQ